MTHWSRLAPVTPSRSRDVGRKDYGEEGMTLAQGEEMGRFNMGSTVILVFPRGFCTWEEDLRPGDAVMLGERIGRRD